MHPSNFDVKKLDVQNTVKRSDSHVVTSVLSNTQHTSQCNF